MKRLISGIVVGTAILAPSACTTNRPDTPVAVHQEVIRPADVTLARSVMEANRKFWLGQRISGIATVQLKLVSGDDTYQCTGSGSKPSVFTATSSDHYCPDTKTVVGTAVDFNTQHSKFGLGTIGIIFSLSHEVGHAVEQARGEMTPALITDPKDHTALELKATEYAGEFMASEYNEQDLNKVANYLRQTPMDTSHGTSNMQADAFLAGVHITDSVQR